MPKVELTREQVSFRLGCSVSTVQRFENEGKLKPRREKPVGQHGRVWFDPAEVEKLAKEWKPKRVDRVKVDNRIIEQNVRGKIAAKVIPMFEAGITNLAELCVASEADPLIIQQLYETWKLGLDGMLNAKKQREQEERDREAQRRHDNEMKRRDWIAMRLEVARIEGKKPAFSRLETPKVEEKKEKTG